MLLSELGLGRVLGHGFTGSVYRGCICGEAAAVKMTDVAGDLSDLDLLLNEIASLACLRGLQGRIVPRLLAHGWTLDGAIYFLATALEEGSTLDSGVLAKSNTQEVKRSAIQVSTTGGKRSSIVMFLLCYPFGCISVSELLLGDL